MRVVIDTNVMLMSISKRSKYRLIFDSLILGEYELMVSNEILSEYVEKIEEKANAIVANNIGEFLINSKYVNKIEVYYKWNLIERDPDDNKFVDCAVAGNANYIVSNDAHFNELKKIDFPPVGVIKIDEFLGMLEKINEKKG